MLITHQVTRRHTPKKTFRILSSSNVHIYDSIYSAANNLQLACGDFDILQIKYIAIL